MLVITLGFPAFSVAAKSFLGYGVIATATKGVTAQYAPGHKDKACEKAAFLKCLNGIG